jgi:hypothetical protein
VLRRGEKIAQTSRLKEVIAKIELTVDFESEWAKCPPRTTEIIGRELRWNGTDWYAGGQCPPMVSQWFWRSQNAD